MRLNPEFRRHIWMDLSFHRLWITPLLLGGIFFLFGLGNDASGTIMVTALTLFILFPVIWGSYLAESSLISEVAGGTWTTQRLTSLSPWSMTWGKLLGGPIFTWYIGLLSLCVLTGVAVFNPPDLIDNILPGRSLLNCIGLMVGLALGCHALGLISGFTYMQGGTKTKRKSGMAVLPPFILTMVFMGNLTGPNVEPYAHWYGTQFDFSNFVLLSIFLHVAWAVIGAWMQMRKELQIANHPFIWIGFVIFLVVYYMGFPNPGTFTGLAPEGHLLYQGMIAFVITLTLTYIMMFYESTKGTELRRWFLLIEQKNIRKVMQETPRWALTAIMALIAAVALMAVYTSIQDGIPARKQFEVYGVVGALFLFMIRDIGIYFYFHFSDKPARALISTLVSYLVLYLLIPSIFNTLNTDSILPLFWPMGNVSALHAILPALLQAGFIGWLAVKRLRKNFWTANTA